MNFPEEPKEFLHLAQRYDDGSNGLSETPLAFYQYFLGSAPGTKLGGHPDWTQYPSYPMSNTGYIMDHLLTVASCEWDMGTAERWRPAGGRRSKANYGPNNDPQLEMGDVGDVYVFVSRQEENWPVKSVFQCS